MSKQYYESAQFPDGTVQVSRVEGKPTKDTQMGLIEDGGHTILLAFPADSDDAAIARTLAVTERIAQVVSSAPRTGWRG